MEGKNIKVYGTLINQTQNTDSSMRDSQHNDLIAVAYQLYDERFTPKKGSGANGTVINIDKYQDIINKRLTALSYDTNGDLTSLYSNLYVSGDTNIGGNVHVDGTSTFDGPAVFNNNVNITGNVNMNIGLNDLNDVVLSTMAVGQVLRYDGSKWANSKISLNDIQMPNASAGQVLKFNGTDWVAGTDNVGQQGATTLDGLTDVDTTGKQNGDTLVYDSTSGTWKPGTISGGSSGSFIDNYEIIEVTGQLGNPHHTPGSATEQVIIYGYYQMPVNDAYRVISAMHYVEYTLNGNTINLITNASYYYTGTKTEDDQNYVIDPNSWSSAAGALMQSGSSTTTLNKFVFFMKKQ